MSITRVGLVTCHELPAGDDDAALLVAALAGESINASWYAWNDPNVDWNRLDLAVVRSTWDYTGDRENYLRWAAGTPRLHNPAEVLNWNSDKIYLRDLRASGLATIDTVWAEPGADLSLPPAEFVLKPTVGAGSRGAGRFDPATAGATDAARAHAAALHQAGRTVMVQPYLADVDAEGETALVYFGGQFSHAITKRAMLPPATVNPSAAVGRSSALFESERIVAHDATADELRVGGQVVEYIRRRFGDLVYMRVDLLPTSSGPVLIEIELTEPSLFLEFDEAAPTRFAAAIAAVLGRS